MYFFNLPQSQAGSKKSSLFPFPPQGTKKAATTPRWIPPSCFT